MHTLREIGERTATAREVKGFWSQVIGGLEQNTHDTPFVLLYSVTSEADSDDSSMHSNSLMGTKQVNLEGNLGVPEGHQAAPQQADLKFSDSGFTPWFREVTKSGIPMLLQTSDGTLPANLIDGINFRGFGDRSEQVVICPIHPTGDSDSVLGFLVMAINPRRPYDNDYKLFIQLMTRQLATSMASVVLFEEEIRRGQRAAKMAAIDRIELSEQLAARTQEAVESEVKFTRMAELAPVGMYIGNSEGRVTYLNNAWYEISGMPHDIDATEAWGEAIYEGDRARVVNVYNNVVKNKVADVVEFRFNKRSLTSTGVKEYTWALSAIHPELKNDGSLKAIFGSVTDISNQKWAEDVQKKRTEEAIELKRQQGMHTI
jgi:PAS domain S-box-containing protein